MERENDRRWHGLYLVDGLWIIGDWSKPPKNCRMQVRIGCHRRAERTLKLWNRGRSRIPQAARLTPPKKRGTKHKAAGEESDNHGYRT